MRRDVFEAVGGFDPGLVIWGMEDAELSLRLWTLGYECALVPAVDVAHLFRPAHPYRVDWEVVLHNLLRVAAVHFGGARIERLVACLTANSAFPAAFARLAAGDAWARRAAFQAERRYDDDWFFRRFDMPC
jgi:GT2 family glycosyltransferase